MRFNLARFNLARTGKEIKSVMNAQEVVECVAGGKLFYFTAMSSNETVNGSFNMHIVIAGQNHVSEAVLGDFTLRKLMLGRISVTETVNAAISAAKNILAADDSAETVEGAFYAGKQLPLAAGIFENNVGGAWHAGKTIPAKMFASEIVECDTEATLTQHTIAEIAVSILPGGEIRINSDIFTALMGLENILHAYEGGWISLARDAVSLVVDSGTGGELTGEIIYNERFV